MILNPNLILRLGGGICFVGHGVLALTAKAGFVNLLGTFGLDETSAILLLKLIGCLDIAVGLLILFKPTKLVLRWAMLWTGLTILAWGIHGDSIWDLFRRATYLTTPLALLFLMRRESVANASVGSENSATTLFKLAADGNRQLTIDQEQAIRNLDLSKIAIKLMDVHEGEGWSKRQCEEVTEEYRRYLTLNLLYPKANIVPNIAVDTMWHYHILDTQAYYDDCQAIFGHILHHYPYFGMGGATEHKQFISAFDRTKMLYEKTFAKPMEGPDYLPSFQMAG